MDSHSHLAENETLCDEKAEKYLLRVAKKKHLAEYSCFQYKEDTTGDYLIVCEDGSVLYTPYELGSAMNIKAFCNGIRTEETALSQRIEMLKEELSISA